jgi:hypothetical protein
MSFYGFALPERWEFCPTCLMELKVRVDGKFPQHSPGKGGVVAMKDKPVERCQGSGQMAPRERPTATNSRAGA